MESTFRREAYELLGVPEDAPPDQIRRAYRALVKSWHPDRFVTCPSRQAEATVLLRRINAAYACLMAPGQWRMDRPGTVTTSPRARRRVQRSPGRAFVIAARTGPSSRRATTSSPAPTAHPMTARPSPLVGAAEIEAQGLVHGDLPWGAIAFVCAVVLLGLLALADPTFVEFLDYLDSAPVLDEPL